MIPEYLLKLLGGVSTCMRDSWTTHRSVFFLKHVSVHCGEVRAQRKGVYGSTVAILFITVLHGTSFGSFCACV
jgi:hypothetical protein